MRVFSISKLFALITGSLLLCLTVSRGPGRGRH